MATGELSDADVFGAQPAPAAPQSAPQAGDGSFVDAPSGAPLNPAQTAAYQALLAQGKFDPKAEPGSAMLPLHQAKEGEEPEAGKFYVDLGGNLKQAGAPSVGAAQKELSDADVFGAAPAPAAGAPTDTRPTSQSLGALEGVTTMFKNGINVATGDFPALMGLPRQPSDLLRINPLAIPLKLMAAGKDAYAKEMEKTYRPGLPGKIAGEVIAGAPLGVDELGILPMSIMQGALTSEATDPLGKLRDIALSAAAGKAGDQVAGALSRVVKPTIKPAVQWALDNGIRLTPGAIAGGVVRGVEGGAAKGTLAGPMVSRAQRQMIDDANLSAVNNALGSGGMELPKGVAPGTAAVDRAHMLFGVAYDRLAPKLTVIRDPTLDQQLAHLTQTSVGLEPALATRFQSFVGKLSAAFDADGRMPGPEMRKLDSILGQQIRRFGRSDDPYHQEYADHIGELQDALREATERTNPAFTQQLSGLNSGYAQLVRLDKAAVLAKQNGGVWTPAQLMQAVTAPGLDTSGRQTSSARGRALLQDWAQSAKEVLPSAMPNAGDFWSHLPELAVTYGVGHEAGLPAVGKMLLGEGALGAAYTPAAQTVLRAAMTQRPGGAQNVANIIEELRPLLAYGASTAAPSALQALPAPSR